MTSDLYPSCKRLLRKDTKGECQFLSKDKKENCNLVNGIPLGMVFTSFAKVSKYSFLFLPPQFEHSQL